MDASKRGALSQAHGSAWEQIFERRARSNGLLPVRNPLAARPLGNRRFVPMRSNLDWLLLRRDGLAALVDTKSYAETLMHSDIDPKQLERARLYAAWGVPSGFVAWFRRTNAVVFLPAQYVDDVGPGHSFGPGSGVPLGDLSSFDLNGVFRASTARP